MSRGCFRHLTSYNVSIELRYNPPIYRGVVQLAEQRSPKPYREGSSPSTPATKKALQRGAFSISHDNNMQRDPFCNTTVSEGNSSGIAANTLKEAFKRQLAITAVIQGGGLLVALFVHWFAGYFLDDPRTTSIMPGLSGFATVFAVIAPLAVTTVITFTTNLVLTLRRRLPAGQTVVLAFFMPTIYIWALLAIAILFIIHSQILLSFQ